MNRLAIICGSPVSGRSRRMDEVWHENRGRALMLLPAASAARRRLHRWIRNYRLPGIWGSPVRGISEFARFLVDQEAGSARMISTLERRLLVLRVLESVSDQETGLPPLQPEMLSGLARHLLQVITALKQAAIEPAEFRRRLDHAPIHPCDQLVAQVYQGYQDTLKRRGCYDVPGLYWAAEEALRQGQANLPDGVEEILLDGFDDFTPSQTRFLAALSERAKGMCIGLNYDAQDDRSDLYVLQQEWIHRILKSSEAVLETCVAPPPKTLTEHVASKLFWRNPPGPPTDSLRPNLIVTACIDLQQEVEHIGRKVKMLLTDGSANPGAVAVVFADVEQAAGALRALFREMGVPVALHAHPPLTESVVGAWLLLFLEAMEHWDRDAVVSLLTSPLFDPASASSNALAVLPALARQAGIVTGRASWVPALERLKQAAARMGEEGRELPDGLVPETLKHLECMGRRLARFDELAALLPSTASVPRFAAMADSLLTQARLEVGIRRLTAPEDVRTETSALGALRAVLESMADMAAPDEVVLRGVFVQRLRECLRETCYQPEDAPSGAVVCGGLALLRNQSFDYVFAGGLNEGILPAPESVNALYDESDVQRLRRAGIPVEGQRERGLRERLLFLQMLTAAQRELALSYRLQDADGRDALPSPFVADVLELTAGCPRVASPPPLADAFVPDISEAASPRDLASATFHRRKTRLQTAFSSLLANQLRAAEIEARRHDDSPFGAHDGVLQNPELKREIARQFGPAHCFSANQIERYLQCPFHFFMERVLRIRETRQPEGEVTPLTRGIILHNVLERFHARHPQKNAARMLEDGSDRTHTVMRECISEAFARHAWRLEGVPAILRRLEQDRAENLMRRYLKAEAGNAAPYEPVFLEWSFGPTPDERASAGVRPPFTLETEGETIRFAGKVDRVDCGPDGWRILDYKFGLVPEPGAMKSGLSLQLTLYAWAVSALMDGGRPCPDAAYVPVGKKKYRNAFPTKPEQRAAQEAAARRRILEAVRAIRNAEFPPVPDPKWKGSAADAARYETWRVALKMPKYEEMQAKEEAGADTDSEQEEDA